MLGAMDTEDQADQEGDDRPEAEGPESHRPGLDVHQPHDKVFKIAFSETEAAAEFFKWRLEQGLGGALDRDSLRLVC